MTWDGIPEHRNLRGEGDTPPHLLGPQERKAYMRRIIEAAGHAQSEPADPQMPPDPFNGTLPGAIAQAEMLQSLLDAGFTEPQALYYMACLLQVGLAMRMGRFDTEIPPWPPQDET